jgi:hypothetical protein
MAHENKRDNSREYIENIKKNKRLAEEEFQKQQGKEMETTEARKFWKIRTCEALLRHTPTREIGLHLKFLPKSQCIESFNCPPNHISQNCHPQSCQILNLLQKHTRAKCCQLFLPKITTPQVCILPLSFFLKSINLSWTSNSARIQMLSTKSPKEINFESPKLTKNNQFCHFFSL